jgi:assimilatory nitrate reductase catalytic subunit
MHGDVARGVQAVVRLRRAAFTYADFEQSDVLIFIGANPASRIRSCGSACCAIAPPRNHRRRSAQNGNGDGGHATLRPAAKSDLTLLYGLANILISSGWIDRDFIAAHTTGIRVRRVCHPIHHRRVSAETGLSADELWHFAQTIRDGKRVSFWWTMGVNQSHESTRTAQAIIALALMTGNIGRPGTGANSITGQCNAMGSRLYANVTSLIGGTTSRTRNIGRKSATRSACRGAHPDRVEPCLRSNRAGHRGRKDQGLWVIATNSSHSWIQHGKFNELLKKLEFPRRAGSLHHDGDGPRADLVLPAAGWGEKEGTLINSERRIGLVKKVRGRPGRPWRISTSSNSSRTTGAAGHVRALDVARGGVSFAQGNLARPAVRHHGHSRLRASGCVRRNSVAVAGRARRRTTRATRGRSGGCLKTEIFSRRTAKRAFSSTSPAGGGAADADFPLVLLSGRGTSAQWHTGSRTNKSDVLRRLAPAGCYVEINPLDAKRLHILQGEEVEVRSRRGAIHATAFVTPTVQPGQVFIPMHYAEMNRLTYPSFDPYSRQPSYKHCAVAVRAAEDGI